MTQRVMYFAVVALIIIGCLIILFANSDFIYSALIGPSRRKEVESLKQKIPEVTAFVEDNAEFMQLLLDAKERLAADEFKFPIDSYTISVRYGENVEFTMERGYGLDSGGENSRFSEEERQLIIDTQLKRWTPENWRIGILIYPEEVILSYARSGNTGLCLMNPAIEIEDPGSYGARFEFTEAVNEDWCIYFCNNI